MNKLKLKILTIAIQLFGGKMLTQIRGFLAGKKTYISMAVAILGGLYAYANGTIGLNELILIIVNATGFITVKAGVSRQADNGK
jgi:hypothetical protein